MKALDEVSILEAVKEMYKEVAASPTKEFHFPTGRSSCLVLGYPEDELNALPEEAVAPFAGVGYPFLAEVIETGDTVLDVGSGSGVDAMIAARRTGSSGQVYGVDVTPKMIARAEENIRKADIDNVRLMKGHAEELPLEDDSVDVVTSNGVFNLVPDKEAAFQEVNRVLKPGGHIQIADIVLTEPVSAESKADPELWAECIVGAEPAEAYLDLIRSTGFNDVAVLDRIDYFSRSPNESTRKAAKGLGAHSIVLTGQKR